MTYDVGFIGYGLMGKAHANALARLPMFFPETPETNRRIVAGRDTDALSRTVDRYGFDEFTTDWHEVVETVDVVYNLTPNDHHADPSIEALETGTHVLCEKPLAATLDDAYGALLEFESGAQGVIEGSRVATGHKNTNRIELIGTKGAIRYDVERLNEFELKRENDRGFQTISATDPSDPYVDAWWPPGHGIGWEHSFVHENYEFLSRLSENTYTPDFSDAYRVQTVIEAIVDSNERGTWVQL